MADFQHVLDSFVATILALGIIVVLVILGVTFATWLSGRVIDKVKRRGWW